MENHLHCTAQSDDVSEIIKEFKSYTARKIIDYCKERKNITLLGKFAQEKLAYKIQSAYQVWQEGRHPEEITTERIMKQKVEYIHNNPVRRGYVDDPSHWRYFSARNYEGEKGLYDIQLEWRIY